MRYLVNGLDLSRVCVSNNEQKTTTIYFFVSECTVHTHIYIYGLQLFFFSLAVPTRNAKKKKEQIIRFNPQIGQFLSTQLFNNQQQPRANSTIKGSATITKKPFLYASLAFSCCCSFSFFL